MLVIFISAGIISFFIAIRMLEPYACYEFYYDIMTLSIVTVLVMNKLSSIIVT